MSGLLQKSTLSTVLMLAITTLPACRTQIRETYHLGQARVVAMAENTQKLRSMKNIQILVAAPNALKIFDGQDIVIERGGSLSHLKGAQLGDRLPNMLQARLIQAFEDTKRLGGVSRPGEGLAINDQILTDIRQFSIQLAANGRPRAVIELAIKIVDDRNGQVRSARIFEASSAILGNDNPAYVQGLERTLSQVLAQIVNWAFDHL